MAGQCLSFSKMFIFLLTAIIVLILADQASAWGVATHMELAQTVLGDLAGIGSGLATLILAHRRDFVCGNVLADFVIGKKLSRRRRHSHHWPAAERLLGQAKDDRALAFTYGFMTHLAADTVAHNHYIPQLIRESESTTIMGHLYWELRLDLLTTAKHRAMTGRLLRTEYPWLGQIHAEQIYPQLKWFGLNRSVFTKVNRFVTGPRVSKAIERCQDFSRWQLSEEHCCNYREQARQRMVELILEGPDSKITRTDPNGYAALKRVKSKH